MELKITKDDDFIDKLKEDPESVMMIMPESVTQEYHVHVSDTDTGFPLKADLYYKNKRPDNLRPAIIFMHDWASGRNPEICGDRQGSYFALVHDFLFVPLYYRQPSFSTYPGALKDLKTCVRWLRSVSEDYAIDPEKIAVMGSSAGTQWSFLGGATNGKKEFDVSGGFNEFKSDINLVLLNAAICNFVKDFSAKEIGQKIIGDTYENAKEKFHAANPIENVHPGVPPVFMAHGDQDESCPIESAQALADKLKECGVTVELMILPGRNHGSGGFAGDLYLKLEKMSEFVKANFDK